MMGHDGAAARSDELARARPRRVAPDAGALPWRRRARGGPHRGAPRAGVSSRPFSEYDARRVGRWLAAGIEAAYAPWPAPVRDVVSVNATVPPFGPERAATVLARFDGCTTAKVKVAERGQTLADDLDRVAAVRDAMGPAARIRVDANGGWDVETARRRRWGGSRHTALEYAEQPCATVEELAELRTALARNGIDVLDRRRRVDPQGRGPAARGRARRPPTSSSSRWRRSVASPRALEIVEACGLPASSSSALDTSVGIAAGVALAAALPS